MTSIDDARRRSVPDERPHLQRVPPHDLATEEYLLGASLLTVAAARVVAELDPAVFYKPSHQHVADAVKTLVGEGSPTDSGTVAALLRQRGLLDVVGGVSVLIGMQSGCPATTSAAKWAGILAGYAAKRRILSGAAEVAEAVYRGNDTAGLIAEMHTASLGAALTSPSSWELVNLASVLAGDTPELVPTFLQRTDREALLYPGKVHSFIGESEGGKSWLGQYACKQALEAGLHVLYADFEAAAVDLVGRLLEMGLDPSVILERFHYVNPADRFDAAAAVRLSAILDAYPIALAILDGVAEALALNAWDENSASDVTSFFVALPRRIAATGAAVALIDHVVKDKEQQGRYARGSGAKLNAVDGAVYKLEAIRPFGRGQAGASRVIVTKDRHGWVRRYAAPGRPGEGIVGELHLTSEGDGRQVALRLVPPTATGDSTFRPTGYMQRLSKEIEGLAEPITQNAWGSLVQGKRPVVTTAIRCLLDEGYVTREPGARNSWLYRSVRPFQEDTDTDEADGEEDF